MPKDVELTVVRNGAKVVVQEPTQDELWIAVLLKDRADYIAAGHLHLIPGIDATLAHYGYEGELDKYETETKQEEPENGNGREGHVPDRGAAAGGLLLADPRG